MADSTSDVSTLEHEVEEARERLANTIGKLTDRATQAAMKNELMEYVHGYKDRLLDGARSTANEKTSGLVADLKQRAMNNPLGAALIGAGIAYRLYRHPPLTTLLLGGGIAMLMRGGGRKATDPTVYRAPYDHDRPRGYVPGGVAGYGYPVEEDAPGSTTTDRMMQAASQAGEKARAVGTRAREAAYEAGLRIADTAGHTRETAYDVAERTRETGYDTYERARSATQDVLERTRSAVQDRYERTSGAISDSYERAADRVESAAHNAREGASKAYESVRTSPLALGAVGVVAGAAIGHALRSTDTGDRFVRRASDYAGRGARGVGSSARYAARRAADSASELASSVTSAASGLAESFSSDDEDDREDRRRPARRSHRGGPKQGSGRGRRGRAGEDDADMMSSVADAASAAYRTAADQAAYAGRRGADLSRQAAGQVADLAHNYPLLLGAIGVALGAAAGLAMRPTESEDELLGPYSDALKSRAREMASEQYEDALGAANELAEGLRKPGDGEARYGAADWETVIGGGAPPGGAPAPGQDASGSRG